MAIQVEMPDEIKGGADFLKEEGRFHFVVIDTDENPKKKGGEPIDGFKIMAEVQSGPNAGKRQDFMFHNPKPTSNDGGEWAKKKIAACMVALGFARSENMGKGMEVELSDAIDRQFLAEVEFEKDSDGEVKVGDNGQKFLQLSWSNIFHVDDPAAKGYSRNDAAIRLLPAEQRINDESFFDAIRGKKKDGGKPSSNGNGNGAAKAADKPKSPASATSKTPDISTDLGDL